MEKSTKIFLSLLAAGGVFLILKPKKSIAKAADIIKKFEGYRAKAYRDSVNVLTIGYGTTKGVKEGDIVNEAKALTFLKRDMEEFANVIKSNVKRKLNDNQFAALLSLVYNIGGGAFKKSTLLKKINSGASNSEIEPHFLAWKNAGGKPILLSRRKKEFEIFKS